MLDDELAALPTDKDRAFYCKRMAEQLLIDYTAGRKAEIAHVLASRSHQFDNLDDRARTLVGGQRWAQSGAAREMIGDQRLFLDLFAMYARAASLRAASSPHPG